MPNSEGFRAVECYCAWSLHSGFEGAAEPRTGMFLSLCVVSTPVIGKLQRANADADLKTNPHANVHVDVN